MRNKKNVVGYIASRVIGLLIALGLTYFAINSGNNKSSDEKTPTTEKELVMTISDVSKNCLSNNVLIYSNLDYEIFPPYYNPAIGPEVKYQGNIDYKKNLNDVVAKIKTYETDDERYMNYRVILKEDESYTISMEDAKELNELLDLIPHEDIFWC